MSGNSEFSERSAVIESEQVIEAARCEKFELIHTDKKSVVLEHSPQGKTTSTLGTQFDGAPIYRFREFKLFVSCTGVQSAWQSQFNNCPIQIIETPLNYKDWGYLNFPAACCVIAHASTYNSGRTRWTARYYFVQDEYIGNFPENSKILKWSEFPTYYPDEEPPTD